MICIEDQTALHAPVWINEVKLTRCLIDSGSEVNLISVKDAVKHGFSYEMGGIKKIFGFNGSSSPVDGLMDCEIRLGPNGDTVKVEFLVTPNVTILILGCPALAAMGLMMDCKERILTDDHGNVVRCSAVHNLKKLKKPAVRSWTAGRSKDLETSFSVGKARARFEQLWSTISTRGLSIFGRNHVGILAGKAFFLPPKSWTRLYLPFKIRMEGGTTVAVALQKEGLIAGLSITKGG